jgi:predicted pyridoxine 5'-phosphate oxidase superfamily flavin-nucleotide-binding protein
MTRELRTTAELREFIGEPAQAIAEKAIDHVDAASARFIAASPFFLLATTAADGSCDVSPQGARQAACSWSTSARSPSATARATAGWTA